MQIVRTPKNKTSQIISLEDFEGDIKGRFVFLELGKHSVRIESHVEAVDFLKDGFKLSTVECFYYLQKICHKPILKRL